MTGAGPGDHGAPRRSGPQTRPLDGPGDRRPGPGDDQAPVSVAESGPEEFDPTGSAASGGGPAEAGRRPQGSLARAHSPWRTAFIAVAVVGLVVGIGWALLGSKLLVVRSVAIHGTHLVSPATVRSVAAINPREPMIRVDTQAAARRLEGITQVKSATVTKSWPDRIVITIHERTPALAVRVPATAGGTAQGSSYDLIDPAGVVVRSSATRPASMPVFQTTAGPGALRGNPGVAAAVSVLHELPPSLARTVAAMAAPTAQEVKVGLANGITIVWGDPGEAREKATELAILMRTHARYYDVSAPGSAVTR